MKKAKAQARTQGRPRLQQLSLYMAMALPVLAQAQQSTSSEAATLPEVKVQAQTLGETTEGTGSYTSGKARTATPLSLSLRDTPQSVSVVTQQQIEDQNLRTIMDVVNNTTGVSVNRYETNRAQFNARGFNINSLMIDGVPTIYEQPWSSGEVFSNLSMYDRVEVVRGANGLMAGAGDPSASINLVHKRARSKEFTGSVELSAGSWNTYGTQADISSALNQSGSVRGRVVATYNDGQSWVNMLSNKRQSVYGTVDIDLSRDTVLWLGASYQANDSKSPMWGGLPVWDPVTGKTNDWDVSKTTSAKWSKWNGTYENYFANLEHAFDNGWKAKAGYSQGVRKADSYLLYLYYDNVYGPAYPGMASFPGSYRTQTVQDDYSVQAGGPFSLLGRQHEAAFGYTLSNQKFEAQSRSALTGYGGISDFATYDGNFPEPTWGPLGFYEGSKTTQQGLYGVTRISLADPLKLIAGARLNSFKKASSAQPEDLNKEAVTPYAGLVFDLSENLSTYASYTDIFLPQSQRDANKKTLAPILGRSLEAGVKGEFLDGRLNASSSVFEIRQEGLAKSTGVLLPGGMPNEYVYQASDATSRGFEFEISGQVSSGWNASLGYTQFTSRDTSGNDANSLYPRKLLRLFSTYRLPGELSKWTLGGGVNWQDSIYTYATDPQGKTRRIEQKSYSLVNLMARYEVSKQLSAQLNINNALDEKYFDVFDAYGALTYGAPRSVTLTMRYKF